MDARTYQRKGLAGLTALLLATLPSAGCRRSSTAEEEPGPDDTARASASAPPYTVAPFRGFHFDQGDWAAYVVLEPADVSDLKGALPRGCLVLKDRAVLEELKHLAFKPPSGADMATVQSALLFVLDGQVVYESNLLLTPHRDGLQTLGFGWIEPEKPGTLMGLVKRFEPLPESEPLPLAMATFTPWCTGKHRPRPQPETLRP
ncbi:hypothetical protein HPC49_00980 [Pyxidicoccus fallax]|uniref:Lipoprotein n=1 Tax=Pyxidicoccus fallax TaxID=394095 RepID=A0A848LA04_9BACT|nr:hypothetical protein [Pyxidicoccus fallax]NMO13685.1 hypothetical protein [Pyxidicoccus fallax]NPC76827.1 hypothetical protein [Pyxidicoccus fallax]